MKIRVGVLFV